MLGIDDRLLDSIGRLGWKEPTEVQKACFAVKDKRDLIVLAETG